MHVYPVYSVFPACNFKKALLLFVYYGMLGNLRSLELMTLQWFVEQLLGNWESLPKLWNLTM